ncbi:MAG: uroporphyrinogen decarboxylase family protein [Victivallales bacterium]|jgi:uroporphyrinogen decarboxylase
MKDHVENAEWLVAEAHKNGGLAPLDVERFWKDQDEAVRDPFSKEIQQLPLNVFNSTEVVFDELGIPEDFWKYQNDESWRLSLNKAFNDKAEKVVGRRLLSEKASPPPEDRYPATKGLHDVFEARNIWHEGSWWLQQSAGTEDELKALLDKVEGRDVRKFILPEGWDEAKARLMTKGIKPNLYRGQRGPCTFATSVYGAENMIFLTLDNPDLVVRFRDAILKTMLEIGRVLDEEAGYTKDNFPHGFWFADDNCCLFNPEMYELFGYPILKGVFDHYSPNPGDSRYQHSDSAMAHLLPFFEKLGMTGVNFGPTLTVSEIRKYCPKAIIYGQLAPFTFSRNEEVNMVCELLRDFGQAKEKRGLLFSTAGSINNGSRLTGMRLLMAAAQLWCRYE